MRLSAAQRSSGQVWRGSFRVVVRVSERCAWVGRRYRTVGSLPAEQVLRAHEWYDIPPRDRVVIAIRWEVTHRRAAQRATLRLFSRESDPSVAEVAVIVVAAAVIVVT